ncbi:hypothetical protein D3C76_1236020 [compost metagenome]
MAVIAHAQYQYVDTRQFGQGLIGFLRSGLKTACGAIEAEETRLGSRTGQQMALEQAGIAVGMLDRHPAFIGQGHQHLRPVQRLLEQRGKKRHRTAAARHHQGGLALGGNGRIQAPCHILGQPFSQQRGCIEITCRDLRRQLQFRYRHTRTSHRG